MTLTIDMINIGDELPSRQYTPTNVSLFAYNAAVWNAHRIHYDADYTTQVEKHPGIVIDGPLQGDWLSQVALNWLGDDGTLTRFDYSNRGTAILGETLTCGGSIVNVDRESNEVELELYVQNETGEVIAPGHATIRLSR